MATRIYLGLSAALWAGYGLYCFLAPGALTEIAGVSFVSATGMTELRAMYGGLQFGIGALALAGVVRSTYTPAALITLAALCGGLGLARLAGASVDGAFSPYTIVALGLEFGSVAICASLLRGSPWGGLRSAHAIPGARGAS